jgi:hypothetical protein
VGGGLVVARSWELGAGSRELGAGSWERGSVVGHVPDSEGVARDIVVAGLLGGRDVGVNERIVQ